MDKQRIQISTSISSLDETTDRNLKSFIQQFLWRQSIGCHIQRIRHSVDENAATTKILLEAETGKAYTAKKMLIEAVSKKFPHIALPKDDSENWKVEPSKEILAAAKISKTQLPRDDSSGAISKSLALIEKDIDSLSLSSTMKRALMDLPATNIISRILQTTGKIDRRVVYFHYNNQTITLDITIMDWEIMTQNVSEQLNLFLPVSKVWEYVNGFWSNVTDIAAFINGNHYYITAETDPDPTTSPPDISKITFTSMEDFYAALKKRGKTDAQVEKIKIVFIDQDIVVEDLSRLTDQKLQVAGLKQLGLREAVLAVLGK